MVVGYFFLCSFVCVLDVWICLLLYIWVVWVGVDGFGFCLHVLGLLFFVLFSSASSFFLSFFSFFFLCVCGESCFCPLIYNRLARYFVKRKI